MKKIIMVISLLFMVQSVIADSVNDRQMSALQYHYTNLKYPLGSARGNVVYAFCCFELENRMPDTISDADITHANQLLEETAANWPIDIDDPTAQYDMYWMLPHLAKIIVENDMNKYLTNSAKNAIEQQLYNFVYKQDNVSLADTSSSNIWIVIDSENHDILRKQVFLTVAQIFLNSPSWSSLVYEDGKTVQQHYDAWLDYFKEYFKQRASRGINIEAASPTYAGVFLESIFIIYDTVDDQVLKYRAKQFMDLFFAEVAIESINGVRGGAKSRTYKGSNTYDFVTDKVNYYNWLFYGKPVSFNNGNSPYDLIPALDTSYRLNQILRNIYAENRVPSEFEYISVRPGKGTHTTTGGLQYDVQFPSDLLRYSYITTAYILGTWIYDENQDYTLISDQNRWYGMICKDSLNSRIFFSPDTADDNNTYYDYVSVQKKSALLLRKHKDSENIPFRVFISNSFAFSEDASKWVFGSNSDSSVYFALYSTDGDLWGARYLYESAFPAPGQYVKFKNDNTIVVLEFAMAADYASYDAFKNDIKDNSLSFVTADKLEYQSCAGYTLGLYRNTNLPEVDGQSVNLDPEWTYACPYISSEKNGSIIHIADDSGDALKLDFQTLSPPLYLDSDLNKDGYVNLEDIEMLMNQWLQCTMPDTPGCVDAK